MPQQEKCTHPLPRKSTEKLSPQQTHWLHSQAAVMPPDEAPLSLGQAMLLSGQKTRASSDFSCRHRVSDETVAEVLRSCKRFKGFC